MSEAKGKRAVTRVTKYGANRVVGKMKSGTSLAMACTIAVFGVAFFNVSQSQSNKPQTEQSAKQEETKAPDSKSSTDTDWDSAAQDSGSWLQSPAAPRAPYDFVSLGRSQDFDKQVNAFAPPASLLSNLDSFGKYWADAYTQTVYLMCDPESYTSSVKKGLEEKKDISVSEYMLVDAGRKYSGAVASIAGPSMITLLDPKDKKSTVPEGHYPGFVAKYAMVETVRAQQEASQRIDPWKIQFTYVPGSAKMTKDPKEPNWNVVTLSIRAKDNGQQYAELYAKENGWDAVNDSRTNMPVDDELKVSMYTGAVADGKMFIDRVNISAFPAVDHRVRTAR